MAYIRAIGPRTMTSSVTTVDCQKQVRSWRLLRSLIELLIPTCNSTFLEEQEQTQNHYSNSQNYYSLQSYQSLMTSSTITGTIFGYRKGKVSFCIQPNANSNNPILLLELAVPTSVLAKEMRGGTLRIVLESTSTNNNNGNSNNNNLFSNPVWIMYCNGRKVGYAVKRRPKSCDLEALRLMRCVNVGTGVISNGKKEEHDELMYLRANFQRVRGGSSNSNCESFHLVDPQGSIGQELSIFFLRSHT